jgi:hypothetical protein
VKWFEVMGKELQNPALQPENIYNMDETGVMLNMPSSVKVLVGKDDIGNHRASRVKRTMVTAIECVSGDGRCLNPMILWPAKTHRANWTTHPTPGWFYAHSETGFSDSYISLQWLKHVFDPQTKELAGKRPRMLIWDGFGTHETLEILEFCFSNNIILCRMPSHSSHKLQPCDVAVFGPLKAMYREQVERMERGGVNTVNKQHFTYLYSPARERAMTKKNILGGWRGSGLFPFDPDRVLAETPKPPPTEITIPNIDEVRSCAQNEVPPTPVTPVAVEALTTLQKLIKQDTVGLDEANQRSLQRHVQKLTNAAHTSFARSAMQQERIQFLLTINDEAKVRRSTKAIIIGDARVMSYEDLEKARAERAAKDAAKANGKGKRGRKPKKAVSDADASGPGEQEADIAGPSRSAVEPGKGGPGQKRKRTAEPNAPGPKAKVARMSDTHPDAPKPKAPVAFMSKTQLAEAAEVGVELAMA